MLIFLMLILTGSTVHCLTCYDVKDIADEKAITIQKIKTIPPKHLIDCLPYIARDCLEIAVAKFIWKTLRHFYGGIPKIPQNVLAQLHWVTVAITAEEYANITISSIDAVKNFGLPYNLDHDQLEAIADRVREDFAGKMPEDYTYYDLQALNQILCVFNRSEIEQIHPKAYKQSASFIGKLINCSSEVLIGFANLAVHEDAFGPLKTWARKTLAIVGNVAEHLPGIVVIDLDNKTGCKNWTYKGPDDLRVDTTNLINVA